MDLGVLFPSEIGLQVRLHLHNRKDITSCRIIFITSISIEYQLTVTMPEEGYIEPWAERSYFTLGTQTCNTQSRSTFHILRDLWPQLQTLSIFWKSHLAEAHTHSWGGHHPMVVVRLHSKSSPSWPDSEQLQRWSHLQNAPSVSSGFYSMTAFLPLHSPTSFPSLPHVLVTKVPLSKHKTTSQEAHPITSTIQIAHLRPCPFSQVGFVSGTSLPGYIPSDMLCSLQSFAPSVSILGSWYLTPH